MLDVSSGLQYTLALMPVKEWMLQQGESKQAKSKSFLLPCSGSDERWVFLLKLWINGVSSHLSLIQFVFLVICIPDLHSLLSHCKQKFPPTGFSVLPWLALSIPFSSVPDSHRLFRISLN